MGQSTNNLARAIAETMGYRYLLLLSPRAKPWIEWARRSRYSAPELRSFSDVSPGEFDWICNAVFFRPAQEWLDEIQRWDAYKLAAEGRTRAEIESALWITKPSEFWAAFERYHGHTPEEVAPMFQRWRAQEERRLYLFFGIAPFPEDYVVPPLWERALFALTLMTLIPSSVYDKRNGDVRTFLLEFLHGRILEGRESAGEALAELAYAPLRTWLRTKYPKADADLIAGASAKAIMDYLQQPERYDPSRKMTLEGFIRQAAWRKASNLTRDLKLRNQWEVLQDPECFTLFETEPVNEPEEGWEQSEAWFEEFLKGLNESDRQVIELICEGTSDRSLFVEVLELGDRSEAEQRKEINRVKQRLRKALRRWIRKKTRRSLGGQKSP
ncbi:MAG: hypothetical protein O2960_05470 [Verrucomicrobia bacterium]|nr:hypothetical protein [Verrucomicrobiota bacterium]